jgi:CheY-like chemotaxis protein
VLARDGAEALARFEGAELYLIWMDIQISVMHGVPATAHILALQGSRRVQFIYVSAHDPEGGLMQAIESGGDDDLTMPILAERLRPKLRTGTCALGL